MNSLYENEDQAWPSPTTFPKISSDQIHLWRVRLDGVGYQDERLAAVLSVEEQERAQRFRFDQHRFRFIRTHAITRMILAKYTSVDPSLLTFASGPRGKPFLAPDQHQHLRFNLSHSGDLMVLGIAVDHELGVDVEVINDQVEWRQVAVNYFNQYELEGITSIPTRNQQLITFYRVWTIKEAYLKARGDGLTAGLDGVVVNLEPTDPDIFLQLPGGEKEKRRWQVSTFRPAAGACGAVVVQRSQLPLRLIQYNWTD